MINLDLLKQNYKLTNSLSFSDISLLIRAADKVSYPKKSIIIEQGSTSKNIMFIHSGLVACCKLNTKGEDVSMGFYKENMIIGNIDSIINDQPSMLRFEALEKTTILSIDLEKAKAIVSKNIELQKNASKIYENVLSRIYNRLQSFLLLNHEERYIQFTKDYPDITNRVPDKYIANALGISAVTLSRIRSRIARRVA